MPLIPGLVELKYIQNTGGGWSILSDYTWLLSLLTSVILVVVLILLVRGIVRHPLGRGGCVLLLAGVPGRRSRKRFYSFPRSGVWLLQSQGGVWVVCCSYCRR